MEKQAIVAILMDIDHFAADAETVERIATALAGKDARDLRAHIAAATPGDVNEEGLDDTPVYARFLSRLEDADDASEMISLLARRIVADSEAAAEWCGSYWARALEY